MHGLRRYVCTGQLHEARGQQAIRDFADMQLTRYPHTYLLPRIWEMRHNLSAYDGAYVALAEALDAPLLTRDALLAASPGHRAQVELI
jgi:predicted nucleic acid-binding protein